MSAQLAHLHSNIHAGLDDLGCAADYFEEILEIRQRIRLFDGLSRDDIRVVCRYLRCYAAPRGQRLVEVGEGGSFLMLLLTGAAETRADIPAIGIEKLEDIEPGATLGETTFFAGRPHHASCITTCPSDFAVLTRAAFNALLLQEPQLGNRLLLSLLEILSDRLRANTLPETCSAAEDMLCE